MWLPHLVQVVELAFGLFQVSTNCLREKASHSRSVFIMWVPQLMHAMDLALGLSQASRQRLPSTLIFTVSFLMWLPQLLQVVEDLFHASEQISPPKHITLTFHVLHMDAAADEQLATGLSQASRRTSPLKNLTFILHVSHVVAAAAASAGSCLWTLAGVKISGSPQKTHIRLPCSHVVATADADPWILPLGSSRHQNKRFPSKNSHSPSVFSCGCRSCCRWWILPLGIKTNISPQNPLHIQIFTFMAEALPFPHVPVHRLGPGNE